MAGKGEAEGCAACAKWLLIIFNVLFCILGIGLLAAGIYTYVELRDYFNFVGGEDVNIPAILLIVFGCITFIIAALGCLGACKESPCLLFTFAAIIGVLLLAEIIVGAVAFAKQDEVDKLVSDWGPQALENAKSNESEGVMATWDIIQKRLKCCGFNGPDDWVTSAETVPPASCRENPDMPAPIYQEGCKDKLIEFMKRNIYIVGGVGVGFALIEILGIVFACCVGCAARKGEYA